MTIMNKLLMLDGETVTPADVTRAGREAGIKVQIHPRNWEKIRASRALVEEWAAEEQVIYGINTSCGGLVNYLLPRENDREFQQNLIRCVTTQVGDFLPDEVVRSTMIARVNSLCRGYSGIKEDNLQIYVEMINRGVLPCIPEKGSLGSSGDLGPLGCIAAVAMGEWKARYKDEILPGREAMTKAGISLMDLNAKEGLSLINGTSCMVGLASHNIVDARNVIKHADVIAALSIETLLGRINPFDLRVHRKKYHPGQYAAAYNLRLLLADSGMALDEQQVSHDLQELLLRHEGVQAADIPVEDAYSLRCTPQLTGPCREAVGFADTVITRELNSSNDNPLILPEYETFIHNGHFQGQYISLAMDNLAIVMTTIGIISDRRVDRFMDRNNSVGLPPFLCREKTGIRMGLMGGQFMTSSLVAENRTLCLPASVQSVPSTADFQDVVSFGLIAGRKARQVIRNCSYILAFELLCAAQAADLRGVEKLSRAGRITYDAVRETLPYLDHDRIIIDHLEELSARIMRGEFVARVEPAVGELMFVDESGGAAEPVLH